MFEGEPGHTTETVLPSGRAQLLICPGRTPYVVGASTRTSVVDTRDLRKVIGVLFRPAGAFSVTGVSSAEIADTVVPAVDIFGGLESENLEQSTSRAQTEEQAMNALEAWLLKHLRPSWQQELVSRASQLLATGESVASVVARGGASRSTLMRWFATHVGTTPKRFTSITRFQRVVHALAAGERDLAGLAQRMGYADQAHLCHEFRRYSDRTPTAYRPRASSDPNHVVD